MSDARTLTIIKPDAFSGRKTGKIIAQLEGDGFRIVGGRVLRLDRERAEAFYAVHRGRPFFSSLVKFMSSGPVVVSALEGDDAIRRYRDLMGATNPEEAAEGTLRRLFAADIEQNAVHGSDADETACQEIAFFFRDLDLVERG